MQAVTFYTPCDIHQELMSAFKHSAELYNVTLYVRPRKTIQKHRFGWSLTRICDEFKRCSIIKDVQTLEIGNSSQLFVLKCQFFKNMISCTPNTRVKDIFAIRKRIINFMETDLEKLVLTRQPCEISDCTFDVFRDTDDKTDYSISIDETIIKQLLLQLDQFMDNR